MVLSVYRGLLSMTDQETALTLISIIDDCLGLVWGRFVCLYTVESLR